MSKFTRTVLASAVAAQFVMAPNVIAQESASADVANEFEVIVVSGSRTEKPLKDVAGSISVVTAEEIENQVVDDMSQLFKYDPSVQVSGTAGQAQNIIVRGMGGDRVLMIKDGMRMNEGYGADGLNDIVGRGFIETDTLKQVEVAKGAASSLYGSDALGGIVVFTTKDASDYLEEGETFAGKVKAGHSSNTKQNNLGTTLALKTGDFEHLLSATVRKGEEQQNYKETKAPLDIDSTSILYKAKYNINEKQNLSLIVDSWKQDVKGDTAYGLLSYFRTLDGYDVLEENSLGEKDNLSMQLRYQSTDATAIYDQLNVSVYRNSTEQTDTEYGKLDIDANFGYPVVEIRDMWKTAVYEQDTVGFLSNASLELNDTHTLGYGLDVEQSESKRHESKLYSVEGTPKPGYPQEEDKFPTTEVFRAGVFVNDEMRFLDGALTVTPGVRFDMYKMDPKGAVKEDGTEYKKFDENNVSFNLGALYRIAPTMNLFAQYGQGFKVPAYDLAYLDHDNSLYGYKIKPSDDLSPEKSDTFELGLRGHVEDFYFTAAAFYTKYDDFLSTALIDIEEGTNPYTGQPMNINIYQYQNIDSVTIKGLEFAGQYYLNDNVSMYANAAYTDGRDDQTDDYITSISPLSGVAGVRFENDDFTSELLVNWAARMTKVPEESVEIPGYATMDFLVNYNVTEDFKVNLAITNLLDKEYVKYINGAGHKTNDTLQDITEAGRTFSASVSYNF
ncbi:TonB-dependent hemoglobin/transferrin/lactoferrin family receptor [Shewanella sp. WXL01]|uniref:TonB-dependent hemoglobin/transferrin/lactoferrin family receptor n=1 Tax=Shewanella sp. WXL01 TaxID=2709721 RepID=UPI0014384BD7|nr:TonB-dependent hemoglobin/transferrin/lactoferrin family receptor [Shewanella sp. WXL01]NKF50729.1 TonB-dependent hemoglobin/transferrin/lactoferrin family receptor [Shewanella sp. WXL01]